MIVSTFNPADHATAPPANALEYATPTRLQPGVGWKRDLFLGVMAGLFISGGFGFLLFGALMAMGLRNEQAAMIAFGTSFMTLGGCFVALMIWFRRGGR
jgi:hypothetical protein